MNAINELFQNIRFLKYYGWGVLSAFHLSYVADWPMERNEMERQHREETRGGISLESEGEHC